MTWGRLVAVYRIHFNVVLCLTLLGLTLLAWSHRFIQDDAFISFRYAYNLVHGTGLVWNAGERTEGYSNFLYTLIMSIPIAFSQDPVTPSFLFGVMTFAASLLFTYALALRLLRSRDFALLTILLLGTNYTFSSYATGGLETQLQASLFVASGSTLVRAMDLDAWTPCTLTTLSLLLSAALLTRLDSALLALVVLPIALCCSLRRPVNPSWRLAKALSLLLPLVVMVGGWLAWKIHYYGDILPNTYYVKVTPFTSLSRGATYLYLFFSSYWLLLLPLLLLLLWLVRELAPAANRRLVILLAVVALWLLYTIWVGGDFMEFRFLVPVLPLGFVCIVWMISQVRRVAFQVALSVLVLAGSLHHAYGFASQSFGAASVGDLAGLLKGTDGWINIGRVLGEALDHAPDVTIAVTASGAIPFYSHLRTIDMLGLNDRWIAKHGLNVYSMPGHQRMTTFSYLVEQGTNLVIAHPLTAETATGFTLSRTSILRFLPMLMDEESLPGKPRILEIPIGPTRKLLALYLVAHPRVDAAIERNGWRSHLYDLWERAPVGRPEHIPVYKTGARVDFTTEQGDAYLWYGWSSRDFKTRWSTGSRAAIVFGLDQPAASVLHLTMGRFLYSAGVREQRVDVELNGRRIATQTLSDPEFKEYAIALPGDLLGKQNVLSLSAQAMSGSQPPTSGEHAKRLGVRVQWMELRAGGAGARGSHLGESSLVALALRSPSVAE